MKIKDTHDLKQMLRECGLNEIELKYINYPEGCKLAALRLWMNQSPETEATAALREELLSLTTRGVFTFAKGQVR